MNHTLFTYDVNEKKEVVNWKFAHTVTYRSTFSRPDEHEKLADVLKDYAIASVLITISRLKPSLYDDPKYMHQTNHVIVSEVIEEARRRMTNRYYDDEKIKKLSKKFKWADKRYNFKEKEEGERSFHGEILDAIFEGQVHRLIPHIIREERNVCKWGYNEKTDEEYELPKEEFQKAWRKRKLELFMPRTMTDYDRVYDLPEPFCHWDNRNFFQQWYFVKQGASIWYTQGGSGGSSQREEMGRMAHTFATLEKKYGVKIPTTVLHYNKVNILKFVKQHDTFKVMHQELTGNYQVNWNETKHLFKGNLIERKKFFT